MSSADEQALLEQLKALRPERVAEMEDFVDFLRKRDDAQRLTRAAAEAADPRSRRFGTIPTMPPTTGFGDT